MKAIEISQPGAANVLKMVERAKPTPKAHDILIEIHAAGINRPDVLQRAGQYAPPPDASDLPGLEAAGIIAAIGDNVTKWQVGDEVTALLPGGGYAEYALTHESHALPMPKDMPMIEAAALCETYFTVWSNLFMRAKLKAGETLLIHGGSSGIGTTAINLAKQFGITTIITAGNDEKCNCCLELGADHAINYKTQDFVEEVKALTNGKGVDVILDMVGGDYINKNISLLALDGRLVQIAFLSGGIKAEVNFAQIMGKRLTLTGSTLRPQTIEMKAAIADDLLTHVWPLMDAGKLKPIMAKIFAFEDAVKAHEYMESSQHIGKIVLEVKK